VAGDEKYGDAAFNEEMKAAGLNRMFLHSHSVSFEWPQGAHGGLFSASAPLPVELSAVIDALSSGARTATRPSRWDSKADSSRKSSPRKPKRAASEDGRSERVERRPAAANRDVAVSRDERSSRSERSPPQPGGRRAGRQRTANAARGGHGRDAPGRGGQGGSGLGRGGQGRGGGGQGRR
jgi:hypothetical protein